MKHSKKPARPNCLYIRRKVLTQSCVAIGGAALFFSRVLMAGNTWTGGGGGPFTWSDPANWGGSLPGYGTLFFEGSLGTTNTLDGNFTTGGNTSMNQVNWNGASAWVMNNANGTVLSLFDNGGTQAKLESFGIGGVTINAPITFAATTGNNWGEINAVNSSIAFGSGSVLTVNGSAVNGIRMFGGTGAIATTFNGAVNASGKYFATSSVGQTISVGGAFNSGDFYLMNNGTLKLNAGANFTTSTGALRLGGDFSTTGSQDLTKGATFQLTPLTGGLTVSALINTVSGNTSGALLIDSQNTSGVNLLDGDFYLDSDLKVQQAAGGTLTISDATTDLKNQTLTILGGGTVNLPGVVGNSTGSGKIVVNGGTLNLTNANTYSGGTTISGGGNVVIGADNNLGTGGTQTNLNGGKLTVTAFVLSNRVISVGAAGGTIDIRGSQYHGSQTNSNRLLGSGTLTVVGGNGTLVANVGNFRLSRSTTYSGNMVIQNGGSFEYGVAGAVASTATFNVNSNGEFALQGTGSVTLPAGNVISLNGGLLSFENGNTGVYAAPISLGAGGGIVGLRDWYNYGNARSGIVSGTISGTGSLTVNSGTASIAGVLTLSGANTYTGATAVSGATLKAGIASMANASGAFGKNSAMTLANGANTTLDLAGFNTQIASLAGGGNLGGNVILGSAILTIGGNSNATNTSYAGVISGTGGLIKAGAGIQTLTGINVFTGGTTVEAGTLTLARVNSANDGNGAIRGNLTINSGATVIASQQNQLGYSSGIETTGLNIIGGTFNNTSTGDQGWGTTVNLTGGTLTTNGGVSSDTTNSLFVLGKNVSGSTAVNSFASGTTSTIAGRLNLDITNPTARFTVQDGAAATDLLITGAMTQRGGVVGIAKDGEGTMSLTGANSFTGTTTVNAGTLNAAASGALGSGTTGTSNIAVNSGGTLLLSGTASDRVNDAATVAVGAAGKVVFGEAGGAFNSSEAMGSLTLSANSILDFATPASAGFWARFSDLAGLPDSGSPTIVTNWNGIIGMTSTDPARDRLIFAAEPTTGSGSSFTDGMVTDRILFDIGGTLYTTKFIHVSSLEAVAFEPVPEPSVLFGALSLLGLVFHRETRRKRAVIRG